MLVQGVWGIRELLNHVLWFVSHDVFLSCSCILSHNLPWIVSLGRLCNFILKTPEVKAPLCLEKLWCPLWIFPWALSRPRHWFLQCVLARLMSTLDLLLSLYEGAGCHKHSFGGVNLFHMKQMWKVSVVYCYYFYSLANLILLDFIRNYLLRNNT